MGSRSRRGRTPENPEWVWRHDNTVGGNLHGRWEAPECSQGKETPPTKPL